MEVPPIIRVSRDNGPLPVSFAQRRLWFLDQLEPNSSFYNSPKAVRLYGELDVPAMMATCNEFIRRHEVLRTTFASSAGEPVQIIHPPTPVPLPLIDLSALPEAARHSEALRLAGEEALRPFNLSTGPLIRPLLIKLSDEEHLMSFTMHHIVTDEGSMAVLVKEVAVLYQAYSQGKESPLEELRIQYADYAAWQRNWLRGEVLEQQLQYWRRQLAGAPTVLELPTDKPRPSVLTFSGKHISYYIDSLVSMQAREVSRQQGVTLYMLLLSVFSVLLMRLVGKRDVVVGSAMANRTRAETEGLIGFLVNMVAMRVRVEGDPTFEELLRHVREVCLGAYAHQEVPFEKVVEEVCVVRQAGYSPLVQLAFGVRHARPEEVELHGLRMEGVGAESETGRYDLTLWVAEGGERLRCDWFYNTDLFEEMSVRRVQEQFERLLRSALEGGLERRVSEWEMRTEDEQRAYELSRKARAEKNASKLRGLRRKTTPETQSEPVQKVNLAEPRIHD